MGITVPNGLHLYHICFVQGSPSGNRREIKKPAFANVDRIDRASYGVRQNSDQVSSSIGKGRKIWEIRKEKERFFCGEGGKNRVSYRLCVFLRVFMRPFWGFVFGFIFPLHHWKKLFPWLGNR